MKGQIVNYVKIVCLIFLISSCNQPKEQSVSIDLIPFSSGDKWGYINKKGDIVINPQFNLANFFSDGLALVQSSENKFGYIDKTGNYRINPVYKSATIFSEGLACVVSENGKPQYIDTKGEVQISMDMGDFCGIFINGLATILVGDKWGYIDKKGEVVINPQFDNLNPFENDLTAVASTNKTTGETLWGFINKKGELKINFQFKKGHNNLKFKEGFAAVKQGELYGFIDEKGSYIINPQFDVAANFKDGLAIICQGDMCGFINKKGKIVINPQFSALWNFSEGLALVRNSDSKVGYIDETGKYVINPQFEAGSRFLGEIAFVKSANKWGIINKKGKYIVNPQFENLNVNFENEGYQYKVVESDYFDVTGVVEEFLEGSDNSSFRGISRNTNYKDLEKIFAEIEILDEGFSGYAIVDNIAFDDIVEMTHINFEFKESIYLDFMPVYKTVEKYDFWKGNYYVEELDYYDYEIDESSTISSISFYLAIADGEALEKSESIFSAINDALINKLSLSERSLNTFENEFMTIVLTKNDQDTSIATYRIQFNV
jgi:hypothetical protein